MKLLWKVPRPTSDLRLGVIVLKHAIVLAENTTSEEKEYLWKGFDHIDKAERELLDQTNNFTASLEKIANANQLLMGDKTAQEVLEYCIDLARQHTKIPEKLKTELPDEYRYSAEIIQFPK